MEHKYPRYSDKVDPLSCDDEFAREIRRIAIRCHPDKRQAHVAKMNRIIRLFVRKDSYLIYLAVRERRVLIEILREL